MSKNVRSLREDLISRLSEDEIARLSQTIKNRFVVPQKDGLELLMAMKANRLFHFLYFQLYGRHTKHNEFAQRVIEAMDKVKEFIGTLPSVPIPRPRDECHGMPHELTVSNEVAGTVLVKPHAWERFIERWNGCLTRSTSQVIAGLLQRTFSAAKPAKLKGHHAVVRLINNKFQPAEYYLSEDFRLRFVVSTENGRKSLFTVERPY